MINTNEYRSMLLGPMRQWMKDAGGESKWVDSFCDGLLLRLFTVGTCKIHIFGTQVNIDIGNTGGYTNDVTDDPLRTIGERLAEHARATSPDRFK
jgi:hypothetical protein